MSSSSISTQVRCRTFVGRMRELQHLHDALALAKNAKGSVVLVRGAAGLGKSRLIREFSAGATSPVFTYNVSPYLQKAYEVPLQLAGAILKSKRRLLSGTDPARIAMERITAESAPAAGRQEIFEAFTGVVRAAARKSAIALICEDVQWCDPDSVDLLLYLCERIAGEAVSVVLTARDEPQAAQAVVAIEQRLSRLEYLSRVRLLPMNELEIRRLVTDAAAGRGGINAASQRRVESLASGNPYFAEELTREALDAPEDAPLPDSVAGAIKIRADRLDETSSDLLCIAAAFGPEFDLQGLRSAAGRPDETLQQALSDGEAAQLLERTGTETYRFAHALAREVLYQRLPLKQRRATHRAIAQYLQVRSTDVVDVAEHWYLSGDRSSMYGCALQAAYQSNRRYAYLDAVLWYERALAVAPGESARAVVLDRLSLVYWRSGRIEAARDSAFAAALAHKLAGDSVEAADSAREAARLSIMICENQRALSIARDALSYTEDPEALLRLHHAIAYICASTGDIEGARAHMAPIEKAQDASEEVAFTRAAAIATFSVLGGQEERWRTAARERRTIVDVSGEGMFKRRPVVYLNEGWEALRLGLVSDSLATFDLGLSIVRERKDTAIEQEMLAASALAQLHTGDVARARQLLDAAMRADAVHEHTHATLLTAAAWLAAMAGDFEIFDMLWNENVVSRAFAGERYFEIGPLAGAAAFALFTQGQAGQARAIVERAAQHLHTGRFAGWTLVAIARFGTRESIDKARELVMTDRPAEAAFAHLFTGIADRDRSAASQAAKQFEALGWPYFAAAALGASGDAPAALAACERHGFNGLSTRLRTRKKRVALALTARETEIARHIAEGKTNAQIARVLSISPRTVDNHVNAILGKLGVENRAAVAARIASVQEVPAR